MPANWGLFACTIGAAIAFASAAFEPARFLSGSVPQPPPQTIGWLEVELHAHVTTTGTVERVDRLRGSEPLATLLHDYLMRWRFNPARENGEPVSTRVVVAAMYRPATLLDQRSPTGPQTVFDPLPREPRPLLTPSPGYPPRAAGDGVVVIETLVNAKGDVTAARVARSAGTAFDSSSVETARRWRFSPAPLSAARPTLAYVIFGFREPVVTRQSGSADGAGAAADGGGRSATSARDWRHR